MGINFGEKNQINCRILEIEEIRGRITHLGNNPRG